MKYICLGYIEPNKFENLSEADRNAMADECFTYDDELRKALARGYQIELHYLWLASPAQAIDRVRRRVKSGGHNVPLADIRRRFHRSRAHLLADYLPLATRWAVWDGRELPVKRLASFLTHDMESIRALISK